MALAGGSGRVRPPGAGERCRRLPALFLNPFKYVKRVGPISVFCSEFS